jgi:putative oxidoreductase
VDGGLDTITDGETNAMKLPPLIQSVLLGNSLWEQSSILLARVSLGIFFAISGGNKLLVPSRTRQMYETLTGAGIPFPHFMTYFVSSVEFVSGCLLVIGMLTSLSCAALIIQMIVAIATVQLATIPKGVSVLDWLDDFLYLPETLYIIILIWLICSGPGRLSVDDRIARALGVSERQR